MKQRLAILSPTEISIGDDSALHAGHAGARDGGHYRLRIVAACFAGKNPLARHRVVYDALGDMMKKEIHALVIQALPPTNRNTNTSKDLQ
ncbi:MAG: BolA family transcriptional regulator [Rhodocyclaceae bacterium]|nr:BolA family transcriptional regulator [Rhodocyclaceae bacterium]